MGEVLPPPPVRKGVEKLGKSLSTKVLKYYGFQLSFLRSMRPAEATIAKVFPKICQNVLIFRIFWMRDAWGGRELRVVKFSP